ncbi:MAG: glycosyltransferase family 4 protein [Candidatus Omnitrophica bacterium]|nr:glycosyltransferase family 4 protein [Candidatus Omnitrophota bacterium]
MRIAIIGSRGIPACYSGVERNIEETVKRLSLKNAEFIVYGHAENLQRVFRKKELFPRVNVIETPTLKNKYLATFIASFFATADVLFRKVDIVHYHCLGPSVFSFLPRIFGKKTVVTIHALDWKRKKWPWFAKIFLWACQFPALYFADKTIVVSKNMEKMFAGRATYIPNGINLKEATPEIGPQYAGWKNAKFILFSGRITEEKGIDCLITAFKALKSDFQLVIAGDAAFAKKYLEYLKSIAGENTVFVGQVDSRALDFFYSQAYLAVFPSEIEGLSFSMLEAASFAKCLLVSNIPEFKEVLKDAGVYFQKGNARDLRNKLEYLINHPEVVKQKGLEAKRIAAGYNWDNIVESLEGIYSQLLK